MGGIIPALFLGLGTVKLPVAVVAVVFGEWRSLHLPMTLGGTLPICVGATLVSLSK